MGFNGKYYFFKIYFNNKKNNQSKILIYVLSSILIIPTLISVIIYKNFEENGEVKNISIIQPNIDPYSEKYSITNNDNLDYLEKIADINKIRNSLILLPETFSLREYKSIAIIIIIYPKTFSL